MIANMYVVLCDKCDGRVYTDVHTGVPVDAARDVARSMGYETERVGQEIMDLCRKCSGGAK